MLQAFLLLQPAAAAAAAVTIWVRAAACRIVFERMFSGTSTKHAGETAGRRIDMVTGRVGSVGAAFSSSSLSLPASVDTFSAVLHLRAPELIARSPSLLKANQGIAEAAAIRGAVPPCAFTLRGKRQARPQDAVRQGVTTAVTTASSSPRRPPYRVAIGQGYSPRLRMMGGEEFMHGTNPTKVTTEPLLLPTPRSGDPSITTADAAGGVATTIESNALASRRPAPHPSHVIMSTASERYLMVDSAAKTNETAANPARSSQGKTTKPLGCSTHTQERPMTASRTEGLCGRLWTGTTAPPPPEAVRPRVLFLVSGQQQQLRESAGTPPCSERRRHHQHNFRGDPVVIPLPPPARVRNSKTAVPRGRKETTASRGWRWGRPPGCSNTEPGKEGENKTREKGETRGDAPSPGSGSGLEADEECYDAPTTAATNGKGDDSARRVLHVRVPHPPPTSLLVLRSVPPTTS